MDIAAFNALDYAVIGVVGLAGAVAMATGFTKMVLLIGAWVGAGIVTLYGFHLASPHVRQLIGVPLVADVATALGLFVVSLVILLVVSNLLSELVRDSRLGSANRALGLVLGLVLGAAAVSGAWLVLEEASAGERPDWASAAQTRPLLQQGAEVLRALLPKRTSQAIKAQAESARKTADQAKEAERLLGAAGGAAKPDAPPGTTGYKLGTAR
ncbi:MAG: CvpA family protein [Alphaproteobacteria bacterium]|nr:CvpA family protein [Alphaproteobacteria bacterium]